MAATIKPTEKTAWVNNSLPDGDYKYITNDDYNGLLAMLGSRRGRTAIKMYSKYVKSTKAEKVKVSDVDNK